MARYEERVFWNLTFRQALAVGLGVFCGWLLWAHSPFPFGWKQTMTLLLIPSVLALGRMKLQGLPSTWRARPPKKGGRYALAPREPHELGNHGNRTRALFYVTWSASQNRA